MSADVYSQLLRRIDEAQSRPDLKVIVREMWRLAAKESLTPDEFNRLAAKESRRRKALNEREAAHG